MTIILNLPANHRSRISFIKIKSNNNAFYIKSPSRTRYLLPQIRVFYISTLFHVTAYKHNSDIFFFPLRPNISPLKISRKLKNEGCTWLKEMKSFHIFFLKQITDFTNAQLSYLNSYSFLTIAISLTSYKDTFLKDESNSSHRGSHIND